MKTTNIIAVLIITVIPQLTLAQNIESENSHKHELMFNVNTMFRAFTGAGFNDSHMSVIYRKPSKKFNYRIGAHIATSSMPYEVNNVFSRGNDSSAVISTLLHYQNKYVSPSVSFGLEKRTSYEKIDFYYGADLFVLYRIGAMEVIENYYCANGDCGLGHKQFNKIITSKRIESYEVGANFFFGLNLHLSQKFALFVESSTMSYLNYGYTYNFDEKLQNFNKIDNISSFAFTHSFVGKIGFFYKF